MRNLNLTGSPNRRRSIEMASATILWPVAREHIRVRTWRNQNTITIDQNRFKKILVSIHNSTISINMLITEWNKKMWADSSSEQDVNSNNRPKVQICSEFDIDRTLKRVYYCKEKHWWWNVECCMFVQQDMRWDAWESPCAMSAYPSCNGSNHYSLTACITLQTYSTAAAVFEFVRLFEQYGVLDERVSFM